MARYVPLVSTIFVLILLLLLLVATEMGPMVAEARTCESQSHRFRGTYLSKSNCANICLTEGFPTDTTIASVTAASAPDLVNPSAFYHTTITVQNPQLGLQQGKEGEIYRHHFSPQASPAATYFSFSPEAASTGEGILPYR